MKLLITGGGTGGHLSVAQALSHAAVGRGHIVSYVGSTSGQDKMWFSQHSDFSHTYFLESSGVVNKKGLAKIQSLLIILKSALHVMRLIRKHKFEAVISVGGYSAAPASIAAIMLRKPLFIQEQNAKIGKLNALFKPHAKAFFSAYEDNSKVKTYPINEHFFTTARVRDKINTIIFLGGSQGAKFINDLALKIAPLLQERGITIIHQCGKGDYTRVEDAYKALHVKVELYDFTQEIESLMIRADLAVSRAGASTLWELTSNGLPAFYIPYPYAASDHQFYNALFILKEEMGWCVRENEAVFETLCAVLDDNLKEKSEKLMRFNSKNSADDMIKIVEESK